MCVFAVSFTWIYMRSYSPSTPEISFSTPIPTIKLTNLSTPTEEKTEKPQQLEQPTTELIKYAVVTVQNANLRTGPGTSYDVAGWAKEGDTLKIVKQSDDEMWLYVADGSDSVWISASIVETKV